MTHPNGLELEAFAAGEDSAHVAGHVDTCDACRGFVEKARGLGARFSMDGVLADARRAEKRRRFTLLVSTAAPLAAAAAAVFFLRSPHADPIPTIATTAPPSATTTAPVALAQNEPDTTFKGGPQLAVVRERTGAQDRFVTTVRVRPGDRLRIEVALDRSQAILAGVMGDDGSWVELMPEAVRAAGTHFSEKSVRIDDHRADGTILVGAPDDVRRARETKRMDGVRALHVTWESL
jgi:hypothetical protein